MPRQRINRQPEKKKSNNEFVKVKTLRREDSKQQVYIVSVSDPNPNANSNSNPNPRPNPYPCAFDCTTDTGNVSLCSNKP